MRGDAQSRGQLTGSSLIARYRQAGADPPFGDPGRDHRARFEGYYWRFADADRGRAVIALCGVSVLPRRRWAVIALASHPSGRVHTAIVDRAGGNPHGVGAWAEGAVTASDGALRLQVGSDAGLHATLHRPAKWSRRAFGGSGLAQVVPGLGQYWHPWAMGGVAQGEAMFGGVRVPLDGMNVYAEKNWGRNFPERWWWGQADAFDAGDVCVAFAGGPLRVAGLPLTPTLVAVRLGERLIALAPPFACTAADVGGGTWRLRTRSASYTVELEGEDADSSVTLPVPLPDRVAVQPRSRQALAGRLSVVVRRRGRILLRAQSRLAGLERECEEGECD